MAGPCHRHLLIAVLCAFTTAQTAAAQKLAPLGESESYRKCMRLARSAPDRGFEEALRWQDHGGAEAARHCAAVALIHLKQFQEAAKRLEKIAAALPKSAPNKVRAQLMSQAGQAWFDANKPERAHAVQSSALKLDAKNPLIWIDRSVTLASLGRFKDAIKDLTAALELNPRSADALTLRASAHRFAGDMPAARRDIVQALAIAPTHAEGLLESGILMRLAGDKVGARKDWLELIEHHDGTPAAEAAKRNLEKLDVKTR